MFPRGRVLSNPKDFQNIGLLGNSKVDQNEAPKRFLMSKTCREARRGNVPWRLELSAKWWIAGSPKRLSSTRRIKGNGSWRCPFWWTWTLQILAQKSGRGTWPKRLQELLHGTYWRRRAVMPSRIDWLELFQVSSHSQVRQYEDQYGPYWAIRAVLPSVVPAQFWRVLF